MSDTMTKVYADLIDMYQTRTGKLPYGKPQKRIYEIAAFAVAQVDAMATGAIGHEEHTKNYCDSIRNKTWCNRRKGHTGPHWAPYLLQRGGTTLVFWSDRDAD